MRPNRLLPLLVVLLLALVVVAVARLWLRDTQEGLPEASSPLPAANDGSLTQQDAITHAIGYCDQGHLAAQGEARIVGAELALPDSEQIGEWLATVNHAADIALWRIELAGQWTIQGPPSEESVTPPPLPQPTRCTVLLNARSGDLISIVAE